MKQRTASASAARRQHWLQQIDASLRANGPDAAAPLALQALADGVEHPAVLNLAASTLHRQGSFEKAVELLRRARKLAPTDPHILNSLGICMKALGRFEPSLEAFDAALRLDPNMAAAHFNRGSVLEDLSDLKRARSAYERAAALDRNYAEPLSRLAWLDALAGDADSARMHGEGALGISPSDLLARMALAAADLQKPDLKAAAIRLSALRQAPGLTPVNRTIILGLTGDLLHVEGHPAEAFAAYEASNIELKTLHSARFEARGQETALGQVRRLTAWFDATDPEPWRQAPPTRPRAADPGEHIFLVGFPRSGTTLLENVLAAHPKVVSLEEKDCLERVSTAYLRDDQGMGRLARISPGEAARQRDAYWSMVRGWGVEPRGRVFIDKLPLSSVQLPVVAKLFPNARVLFARRDPRDVVLSCFRRRFVLNAPMYQLLTLESAAAYYDAVMRLSELYRHLLPLPLHVVRYESLVEDFEKTARAACNFLGLEWHQDMVEFASKARARGIATPSAAQVARGLNREGKGVWRTYREQMAPVLPILNPWIERFGYESIGE